MKHGFGFALAALLACAPAWAEDAAAPATNAIGYPDVGSALVDLQKQPDAEIFQREDGWTLVVVREAQQRTAIWSFVPFGHPAYPATAKLTLFAEAGALKMETRSLCQATQDACDGFLVQAAQLSDFFVKTMQENVKLLEKQELERKHQRRRYRQAEMLYPRR